MTDERPDPGLINTNEAYQAAWIVYINGLEVPAVSATISYGVWKIPECELTMVPDPVLQRLGAEDRLSVQVFYCDYWQEPDAEPQFRLMFDGEIVAWNYTNTQRGRAITFNCVDYMQIFTQIFFFFMSNVDDIAIGASAAQIGIDVAQVKLAGFGAVYPYSLFAHGLADPGDTNKPAEQGDPIIERPIDFIFNVVRAMTKKGHYNQTVPAANFFSPWTKRTNFHRRFVALPFLEEAGLDVSGDPINGVFPILRAVRQNTAIDAVARMAQNYGTSGSVWQILSEILQTLMMEIVMLPTPAAVASNFGTSTNTISDDGTVRSLTSVGGGTGLDILGAPNATGDSMHFLTQYFVKPQCFFGIPPSCNVFFPSQISNLAYSENFITQPTRMYFNEEKVLSLLDPPKNRQILQDALTVAHPEEVNEAAKRHGKSFENTKNMLVWPEEFFKGPVVDRRSLPKWFMFLQEATQKQGANTQPARSGPTLTPGDSTRDVFRLYAAYEYHKERYSRRNGSISLAFNPYPVPGFPCAALDRRTTKMDIFGYITGVQQNLTNTGWSTSVSYSYGRTFSEAFSLLQRQRVIESEIVDRNWPDTVDRIVNGRGFEDVADPVGAIAIGPAEPIAEVRSVLQNFDRAEQFYDALFYRKESPSADRVSSQQLRDEQARMGLPETPTEPDLSAFGETGREVPGTPQAAVNTSSQKVQAAGDKRARRSIFYYPSILEFRDNDQEDGVPIPLKLEGLDATAREDALAVTGKLRKGEVPRGLFETLRAFGLTDVAVAIDALVPRNRSFPSEEARTAAIADAIKNDDAGGVRTALDGAEYLIHGAKTVSNINGERAIFIREDQQDLFNNYSTATRYGARPICTLDEYVEFINADRPGDDDAVSKNTGVRGLVTPSQALVQNDARTFPAKYYDRIRTFIPGPPDPGLPGRVNITNSQGVSGPDGMAVTPAEAPGLGSTDASVGAGGSSQTEIFQTTEVQGLPLDFPENRANWDDILVAYKINVLNLKHPRT